MKRLVCVAGIFAALLCANSAAVAQEHQFGSGLRQSPCQTWTVYRAHPSWQRHDVTAAWFSPESWVLGYISGANRYGYPRRIGANFDANVLYFWMDQYCVSHTEEPIERAAFTMLTNLEAFKATPIGLPPAKPRSCTSWIDYRERPDGTDPRLPAFTPENWVQGYVSAANRYGFALKPAADFESDYVFFWMDVYCASHRNEMMEGAASAMLAGLEKHQAPDSAKPMPKAKSQ
jgi:hypothetical protein